MRVLLDTNAYSALLKGEPAAAAFVRSAEHLFLPYPVIGELLYGFRGGNRETDNLRQLRRFLESPVVGILGLDFETCETYARIARHLREAGSPIPTNDLWITSIALRHHLVLLSHDSHFRNIPGLQLHSWR